MAVSDLTLTMDSLYRRVCMAIGWPNGGPTSLSANQQTYFDAFVRSGLRQFYFPPPAPGDRQPYRWSFLWKEHALSGLPDGSYSFSTGQGTWLSSSGSVTLTDNSFSATHLDGGWFLDISNPTITPGVQITEIPSLRLLGQSGSLQAALVFAGPAYTTLPFDATFTEATARQVYHRLPDDFAGVAPTGFQFARKENRNETIPMMADDYIQQIDADSISAGYPRFVSISESPSGVGVPNTAGPRNFARFYPRLQEGAVVKFWYYSAPEDFGTLLTDGYIVTSIHTETLIASVVDKAVQMIRGSQEKHPRFLELLGASVQIDRRNHTAMPRGKMPWTEGQSQDCPTDGYDNWIPSNIVA